MPRRFNSRMGSAKSAFNEKPAAFQASRPPFSISIHGTPVLRMDAATRAVTKSFFELQ
jgi:hypothetical protein